MAKKARVSVLQLVVHFVINYIAVVYMTLLIWKTICPTSDRIQSDGAVVAMFFLFHSSVPMMDIVCKVILLGISFLFLFLFYSSSSSLYRTVPCAQCTFSDSFSICDDVRSKSAIACYGFLFIANRFRLFDVLFSVRLDFFSCHSKSCSLSRTYKWYTIQFYSIKFCENCFFCSFPLVVL